jgi:protein-L-isoaspartate(D-aspartate) O-methyltransferase
LLEVIRGEFAETFPCTGLRQPDPKVMAAMRQVPRELFVPSPEAGRAYLNVPLSIGHGQTISQPFIVALMTCLLELRAEHRVLEVGTGSGYQAAVLASLAKEVFSVEVCAELARAARERLDRLGYANVEVRTGDGSKGWKEHGPFDRIIVTAAAPRIPPPLVDQLTRPGRLVMPLGSVWAAQELVVVTVDRDGELHQHRNLPVAFVPLLGPEATSGTRGGRSG